MANRVSSSTQIDYSIYLLVSDIAPFTLGGLEGQCYMVWVVGSSAVEQPRDWDGGSVLHPLPTLGVVQLDSAVGCEGADGVGRQDLLRSCTVEEELVDEK